MIDPRGDPSPEEWLVGGETPRYVPHDPDGDRLSTLRMARILRLHRHK